MIEPLVGFAGRFQLWSYSVKGAQTTNALPVHADMNGALAWAESGEGINCDFETGEVVIQGADPN